MTSSSPQQWLTVSEQTVFGLGRGELRQSHDSGDDYKGSLVLNSYESNCMRDWLALRWKAQSMHKTCVTRKANFVLQVDLPLKASNVEEANQCFNHWLALVAADRALALKSRA